MPPIPSRAKPSPMPKFLPAAPETVAIFEAAIDGHPPIEKRKMFGYPCAFVQDNMLFGVFQDRLMLRLSDADRAEFLKIPGARSFEPTPGRTMREYVELPPAIMNSSDELQDWLRRGLAYVQTLPPKVKKSIKAKPGPKASAPKATAKLGSKPGAKPKPKAKLGSKKTTPGKAPTKPQAKTTAKLVRKPTTVKSKSKAKLGSKPKSKTK